MSVVTIYCCFFRLATFNTLLNSVTQNTGGRQSNKTDIILHDSNSSLQKLLLWASHTVEAARVEGLISFSKLSLSKSTPLTLSHVPPHQDTFSIIPSSFTFKKPVFNVLKPKPTLKNFVHFMEINNRQP